MIRPLRKAHRILWALLAVALVVLFAAALIVRRPAPVNPRIPQTLLPAGGRQ